jgi:hypothetical protein
MLPVADQREERRVSVAPNQALLGPVEAGVLLPHQCLLHPIVHSSRRCPADRTSPLPAQECPNLLQAPTF